MVHHVETAQRSKCGFADRVVDDIVRSAPGAFWRYLEGSRENLVVVDDTQDYAVSQLLCVLKLTRFIWTE